MYFVGGGNIPDGGIFLVGFFVEGIFLGGIFLVGIFPRTEKRNAGNTIFNECSAKDREQVRYTWQKGALSSPPSAPRIHTHFVIVKA